VGSWIDQIRIVCAPARADGTIGDGRYKGPVRGGNTGGPAYSECPSGSALSSLRLAYTEQNRQVKWASFDCSPGGKGGTFSGQADANINSLTLGADGNSCPRGEIGAGLAISHGRHVNSIGLICERLTAAAAAPANPGRVLRSTGARPSTATAASPLAFAGSWDTVTNSNGRFKMPFTIQNPQLLAMQDLMVTGQFVNTAGVAEYNGTLQGTVRRGTRVLQYQYSQPGISSAGTGVFTLSEDGSTITGTGPHNGKDKFTWNGTRSK
jgi:hypothetical protein